MKKDITYNINSKDLLALCYIINDYQKFSNEIDSFFKENNFSLKDLIKVSTDKPTLNFKAMRFYQNNKNIIDTINKYSYISNFVSNKKDLDLIYSYLIKHQDKLDKIKSLVTKIVDLKINKIKFNETLDFSKEEYIINTAFNYNFDFPYFSNIIILPNYSSEYIRYKTTDSNYKIDIGCQLINKIYLHIINVNNLWFEKDKLPSTLTKENTFDKIVALRKEQNKNFIPLRNIVDLKMSIEEIENNFDGLKKLIDNIDNVENKKDLIDLLKIALNNLENIKKVSNNYSDNVYHKYPDINEEIVKKEKQYQLDKKLFRYIDID